ncbi:arginase [Terrarubrum flagellatum]|uniref:arginase n=1 Tax=Terrirubrum flagellatum TaxID=2895980 RepID=UPI0031456289
MRKPGDIAIIGAPIDAGASVRGASLGPAALRISGLADELARLGRKVVDQGDVSAPSGGARGEAPRLPGCANADAVAGWARALHDATLDALRAGQTPMILGGDHSLSMGSVSAAARHARAEGKRLVLLWLDAHADYNTPATTPSGNMHGMPVAFLTGDPALRPLLGDREFASLNPSNVHLFGLRSVDRDERAALAAKGIDCVDMRRIDEFGVFALMRDLLGALDPATTHLHVSLDLDLVDPALAPGVGTPVEGGLTWREAHLIMELIHESGLMRSLDLVELNPLLDERGRTARLAIELVASLFGKSVLGRAETPAARAA